MAATATALCNQPLNGNVPGCVLFFTSEQSGAFSVNNSLSSGPGLTWRMLGKAGAAA